jgi:phage shock protein PspC (stress-responsive transcriptional regulator)
MQKVVHASLHGNAFALEEAGYEALQAYLARAAAQLAADPDRDEILGDLEQAIADKCARHLGPHKSVVTAAEMQQVLDEMGPVGTPAEVGPEAPAAPRAPPAGEPVRRLYRVLEGGKLAGLCNGLGAYLGVDANLVRAAFVVLALLTHGAWLLVYLVLVFVVPAAGTPEERAAARGLPFSAQELIDEAKRHYASLEQELRGPWARWRDGWRAQRHQRRQARRAAREARRAASPSAPAWSAAAPVAPATYPNPAPAHYARQVAAGVLVPVMAFVSAAITIGWLVAAAMLVVDGQLLGWSPGLPLWASLLIVSLVAMVIGRPARFARVAFHRSSWRGATPWLAAWDAIFWLAFIALFGWLAWQQSPEVRALVHDLPGAWERIRASWHASR